MSRQHWVSRCTIQLVTYAQTESRQEVPIGGADVAGLTNIPCRIVARVDRDVTDSERREGQVTESLSRRICKLYGYFPSITVRTMRALVDGTVYQIRGVEHDSERLYTRLSLEIVNPHG